MGVGDYIHSKGRPWPADKGPPRPQSRQQLAERATVDVPPTQLIGTGITVSNGSSGPLELQVPQFPNQPHTAPTNGQRDRGAFDTDVEEIDDSTVAGTSVYGFDDNKPREISSTNAAYAKPNPQPLYQPRPARQNRGPNWSGESGDQAMKKTAFDSDGFEDFGSPITSSLGGDGGDDEKTDEAAGWLSKPRTSEEPLSKRLENFWSASKKRNSSSRQAVVPEPDRQPQGEPQPRIKPRKLGQMLPSTAPRKITLPANTSTPRTRFSPPKPSLLDQLDKKFETSPSRQNSQPPPDLARTLSIASFQDNLDSEGMSDDGMEPTIRASARREVSNSTNPFDMTSLTDLNVDDTIQDSFFAHESHELQEPQFSQESSNRSRRNTVIHNKKRSLEADYPPDVLYQKSFSDLQAEPFDKSPTPPPVKSPSLPPKPSFVPDPQEPKSAISHLLGLTGQERQTYLSHMTMDEWEDCGDQIIDRFTHLLSEMKNLRHARRQTAAAFEGEVKRRHEQVETQNVELTNKLSEMRSGGAEVLRGRNP